MSKVRVTWTGGGTRILTSDDIDGIDEDLVWDDATPTLELDDNIAQAVTEADSDLVIVEAEGESSDAQSAPTRSSRLGRGARGDVEGSQEMTTASDA